MKKRPSAGEYNPFYHKYILHVIDLNLRDALESTHKITQQFLNAIPENKGDHRYAKDKWTVKEVIGHLIDCERIMAYRALRFARKDTTGLAGFDEKLYAPNSNVGIFSLKDLASQFQHLRTSTIDLFSGFSDDMLDASGSANGSLVTVLALGYIIPGHEVHHLGVLRDRYL